MKYEGGEGWYEFHPQPANTTEVAHVSANGDVYIPEPSITHDDWLSAVITGNVHKLVRL